MTFALTQLFPILYDAGKIMTGTHDDLKITEKPGSANYVTAYDIAVQQFLYDRLRAMFPDARFIGEESGDNHPELLKSGLTFIIDPIDGTTNFIYDFHHSCISVGVCLGGEMIAGAVYDPYLNELFSAVRGEGAFCNGQPIRTTRNPLSHALIAFGSSPYYRELADVTFETVQRFFLAGVDIRRCGSAALDLCYVACGRCDLFYEARLSPWDHAAGALIVSEAGGIVTDFAGNPPSLCEPSPIFAANPVAYDEGMALLNRQ